MKKLLIIAITILFCNSLYSAENKFGIGTELDALPFISGGYYSSIWLGFDKIRIRPVITETEIPSFAVAKGFENHELKVKAIIFDYCFGDKFDEWWIGIGYENWDNNIKSKKSSLTKQFSNNIITIGAGYIYKFWGNLYVNPWVAVHYLADNHEIKIADEVLKNSVLTPEISLKIGYNFEF